MDLFRIYIPAQDQSIYYLGQIFGFVGNVLPVESASMVLGAMFSVFNTIVLGVGALIIVYVTVVGVVKTAHEGEFLGKHWNNLWVPLRMVLGIAALVPTPSGYSVIQILIMWSVIQGIGAGDAVWTTVLKYQETMGSLTAPVNIPGIDANAQLATFFQGLVCQESARQTYTITSAQGLSVGGYYCSSADDNPNRNVPFCKWSEDTSGLWNIKNGGPQVTQQTIANRQSDGTMVYIYNLEYRMGPDGYCGYINYCDPDRTCNQQGGAVRNQLERDIRCNACKAQQKALQDITQVFSQVGQTFAQGDFQFRQFLQQPAPVEGEQQPPPPDFVKAYCNAKQWDDKQCCPASDQNPECSIPTDVNGGDHNNASDGAATLLYWPYLIKPMVSDINFVRAAGSNYISSINGAVQATILAALGSTPLTSEVFQQAQRTGWIFAGAYYYLLSRSNDNNVTASMPNFSAVGVDPRTDPNNPLNNTRNNFYAAGKLITQAGAQSRGTFEASLPPQLEGLSKLSDGMYGTSSSLMDSFTRSLTGGGQGEKATNPLILLQNFGKILLIIAQVLFGLIMIVIPPLALFGFFDIFVLGTGFNNPIGGALTAILIVFAPLFAIFMGVLFTYGAMLAIYVPLIPYIIYTMGAISWFILVIEAMVAGPLIALGILSPGGEHEVLGKAHHALLLIFGIFLRPAMMVFGLVAAMLLSIVAVTMVNAGFKGVMNQVYSNPGLVEIILFIGAYIGLILAVLNKCFALIHIIPDRVMRYIGGHGEETASTAEAGLSGAKEGVQAAGKGVIAGAAAGMVGRMKQAGKDTKKQFGTGKGAQQAQAVQAQAPQQQGQQQGQQKGGGGGGGNKKIPGP